MTSQECISHMYYSIHSHRTFVAVPPERTRHVPRQASDGNGRVVNGLTLTLTLKLKKTRPIIGSGTKYKNVTKKAHEKYHAFTTVDGRKVRLVKFRSCLGPISLFVYFRVHISHVL
jgi:hypothetical protein